MPAWLIQLFVNYGYFVIFGAILLENAGVPAPGHTAMLAGGALAQQGHMSLPLVIAVGVAAAITGDNIGYWLGRRGGRALLARYERLMRVTPERLARIEGFFDRHGAKTIFIARFVTGLQTVAAMLAGVSRMRWSSFFAYNCAGAVAWAVLYGVAGYLFGASWSLLERWVGYAGLILLGLLALAATTAALLRYRRPIRVAINAHLPAFLISRGALLACAILGSLAIFAKISEDVVTRESTGFDRAVSLAVHGFDSSVLDLIMRAFTFIGSFPVVFAVVIATAVWCWRRGDRDAFFALAAVTAADEALNFGLKHIFSRPRPDLFHEIATLHSYSFPSGHAMAAASIYGTVAIAIVRSGLVQWRSVTAAAVLTIFMIGLSRIYLGVHWVTDVLAGYFAGAALLLAGILWLERRAAARA